MPCMCGDICCPSCGPAQGNWKCPICHEWVSEGCIHIEQSTDGPAGYDVLRLRPEFEQQAADAVKAENEYWEAYARQEQEYDAMSDDLEEQP
jgi:hypothetical protein